METKNYFLVCNKIDSLMKKEMKQIEVQNLSCTVEELSQEIATVFGLNCNVFDIFSFGKLLDASKKLDFYDIKNGSILYLFKKQVPFKVPEIPTKEALDKETGSGYSTLSSEHQGMCIALKSALLTTQFRQLIENLSDFEARENLMTVNPELRNDPSLFGVLNDVELLHAYINRNNIKRVMKRYPYFLEVATHVSATYHEDNTTFPSSLGNLMYRGSLMNYSIDAISEDEDEVSDTSSISSTNTNASMRRLSDLSFSSMLMQAYQNLLNQNPSSSSSSSSAQHLNLPQSQHQNSLITQDMLMQALQSTSTTLTPDFESSSRALSQTSSTHSMTASCEPSVPTPQTLNDSSSQLPPPLASASPVPNCVNPVPVPPPDEQPRSTAQILIGWAPQLRLMHELGITDDIVAIQALEAANGDVQAAINIIYGDNS